MVPHLARAEHGCLTVCEGVAPGYLRAFQATYSVPMVIVVTLLSALIFKPNIGSYEDD